MCAETPSAIVMYVGGAQFFNPSKMASKFRPGITFTTLTIRLSIS